MGTTLTRLRPATLEIEGQTIRVNCKRLTLEESEAHRAFMRELLGRPSDAQEQPLAPAMASQVRTAIETYLSVPPGELAVDQQQVTTGAQLLELIGESPRVLLRALLAISRVSGVNRDEGKPSASESVSVPSSDALSLAPHGETLAPIAPRAEAAGTAPTADATEETATPSSGPTAILN